MEICIQMPRVPDRNGLFFADRHRALGNCEICHGAIKWVYSTRNRSEQMYRMLYDGDPTQLQPAESHLEVEWEENSDDDDGADEISG